MGVRGDLRMLETAVRRRYPVDVEKAAKTVNRNLDDPDPRVSLRAAGIAVLMEGQNQRDEHKIVDVRISLEHDRLFGIAAELGVDVSTLQDAARSAIGRTDRTDDPS